MKIEKLKNVFCSIPELTEARRKIDELIEAHNQSQEQEADKPRCEVCGHHSPCYGSQKQEELKDDEEYYFIDDCGDVETGNWDKDEVDRGRQSFMGIFRDKSQAEERLKQIKSFIQTLKWQHRKRLQGEVAACESLMLR